MFAFSFFLFFYNFIQYSVSLINWPIIKMWYLKTNTMQLIVRALSMIKKGTDKHINKILVKKLLCQIKLLAHLSMKKKLQCLTKKPPFVFNNYPLLHLVKLTAASPLINSCPMQTQKSPSDHVRCFYVLFCLPSFASASSLSVVLCNCRHKNTWLFAI